MGHAWVNRRSLNEAGRPITGAGGFPVEPPAVFGYVSFVLVLNPAFVDLESPDTGSLLEQAQSGDAEAFGELCRVYETPLLRHAMTLCGNATLAEDLAQDSLVDAWKSLRRYNGRCKFFTWLCAILLNRYRNVVRTRHRKPIFVSGGAEQDESLEVIENVPDRNYGPDESAQIRDRNAALRDCIDALPPKHRQVVYLRFYVDDSLEGIAAALGCPPGTVKSRLFKALNKLREMKRLAPEQNPEKAGDL